MDNSQLPGGAEFGNSLLEGIILPAMGFDLDDEEEGQAHRYEYDSNNEELDPFMPPPGHVSAAPNSSPYNDEIERARADQLDQRMDRFNLRLEEDDRTMRSLIQRMILEVYVYGNSGSGGPVPAYSASAVSLETYKYGSADMVSGDSDGCVICIEDFEVGDDVGVVPCEYRHSFHRNCIDKWLARSRICPLCRHAIQVYSDSSMHSV
jgi:hypothetical protein